MKSWEAHIKRELKKEPGILFLTYPYTFLWRAISEAKVKKIWEKPNSSREKIVYIHIPFCKRKCFYCNFVSYFHTPYAIIIKYVKYLKKEIEIISPLASSLVTDSLCIAGGSPNFLKTKELEDILEVVRKFMNLKNDAEMSIEILPDESINTTKLKLLNDYGINRISFGIQSFDDKIKKICNRFDRSQQNIEIYNKARKIGFSNINFDLMYGLPNQTFRSWLKTLTLTIKLNPEHISIYPLTARYPKILFYKYMKNIDVKKMINIFNFTREFLTQRGYFQISRHAYAKRGIRHKYNEAFSNLVPLLGLGLNSISYNLNITYKNTPNLKKYFFALDHGKLPIEKGYILKGKDRMSHYIIKKIIYLKINRDEFRNNFGLDIRYYFREVIGILEKFNLININKIYIKLTPKGIFYEALVKRCFYGFKILREKNIFYKNISS